MSNDLIKKFKLIDEIIKYFESDAGYCNSHSECNKNRIGMLFTKFDIKPSSSDDYWQSSILRDALDKSGDTNISDFHKYLFNDEGLSCLFHDKYAIELLANEEKLFNLNLYLNECFECIKADRKIATAILLRSCVEIFLDIMDFKGLTLAANIDKFIAKMNEDQRFAIFSKNNKQNELQQFFQGIKDVGNDAVHLNGKKVTDFIEKYNNKEILNLFCILIEHSILKDDIDKKNEEDKENRVKSIDFTKKETATIQNNAYNTPST